ncbi:hypothetical protein ACWGHM_30220 [Streptomyces sp. NPDC054904]|uniref:hypothetical protein n=1 Tax=Streptomyces sp. NPDC090054 TaxID=3365933 RepID=UPI0038172803
MRDAHVGSLASCEAKSAAVVANGSWTAYVCHQEYRWLTDRPMLFTSPVRQEVTAGGAEAALHRFGRPVPDALGHGIAPALLFGEVG